MLISPAGFVFSSDDDEEEDDDGDFSKQISFTHELSREAISTRHEELRSPADLWHLTRLIAGGCDSPDH